MAPDNRTKLAIRVERAAEAALKARQVVTPIDILTGIGWLAHSAVDHWRQGRVDYLESEMRINPSRLAQAMRLFHAWAEARGLRPSETPYAMRRPGHPALRFSESGLPEIEKAYRTHWISGELSDRQRERLAEKAARPPELVVISPSRDDWTCHRCGGGGGLLMMEDGGPACLECVGLDDLAFLPAGDATLTRRIGAKSPRRAVVVRFNRTRGRYERQGLLVEPAALAAARGA